MEHREKVRRILRGYNSQKEYIRSLEAELEELRLDLIRITPDYSEHIGHSSEERLHAGAILSVDPYVQLVQQNLRRARTIIARIDRALELLPDLEKELIRKRYIQPKPVPWRVLALQVSYAEITIKQLERKAIDKITVSIYGMDI